MELSEFKRMGEALRAECRRTSGICTTISMAARKKTISWRTDTTTTMDYFIDEMLDGPAPPRGGRMPPNSAVTGTRCTKKPPAMDAASRKRFEDFYGTERVGFDMMGIAERPKPAHYSRRSVHDFYELYPEAKDNPVKVI
jgi:hypothetical protein